MPADKSLMSARIYEIYAHRHDHYDRDEIAKRDHYYLEQFRRHPDDEKVLNVARGFDDFLRHKEILVCRYDLLAGFPYRYSYDATSSIHTSDNYDPRYRAKTTVDYEREISDCEEALHLSKSGEEAETLEQFGQLGQEWMYKHFYPTHVMPDYKGLLKKGFGGIKAEISGELGKHPENQELQAMLICCSAAQNYIGRYVQRTELLLNAETNEEYWNSLSDILDSLRRVREGPPDTFQDAVQLLWLAHEMLYCENFPSSESFGRIDQYLYPFYERDLERGILTKAHAQELLDALWLKFGVTLQGYQNLTLGGCGRDGTGSGANDITIMALRASRTFQNEQPLLCLRWNESMEESVWDESLQLIQTGTGFPALFNEEQCIKNIESLGIPEEDAREFGLIGCVEMAVPGKEYVQTEALRVNWCKVLELLLQHGKSLVNQHVFHIPEDHDLNSIRSFEEFLEWYKRDLMWFTKIGTDSLYLLDQAWVHCYPTPYLSILTEGCVKKGRDVTDGGAIYNHTAVNIGGIGSLVDSLEVIRKLVYEDKVYTLQDIADACANDFRGYEEMLRMVRHDCPKFGNDNDEVDGLYRDLIRWYSDYISGLRTYRGTKYQLGVYSVEDHVKMGMWTGTLPDGRRKGTALSNGSGPEQGSDTNGPTAVINSIAKTDWSAATNGQVLDLKLSPAFFKKETHIDALKALIRTYFHLDGIEIQFNVADRKTLLAAQKHPEQYSDLVVRVSGYSALFTTLMPETQNEIIARTEYQTI